MPVSLHEATVGSFLWFLDSLDGLLDKAEAHCREGGTDPQSLSAARLCDDMWDFAKQIEQCCHHSRGAITGVRAGVFSPLIGDVPHDFAALRAQLREAREFLSAVDPQELEDIAGKDMEFHVRGRSMPFVVKDFLLGFSIPNFYFHVTTAYGILRSQGVPVGKLDYLGKLRVKRD